MGKFTTQTLQACAEEDELFNMQVEEAAEKNEEIDPPTTYISEPNVLKEIKDLYQSWLVFFVSQTESLHEVRTFPGGQRYTLGACIFVEMTRLHGLIHRPILLEEQDNLACYELASLSTESYYLLYSLSQTKHSVWVDIANSYKESLDTDKKEESDENVVELQKKVQKLWNTPIMQYTQSETRILLRFLTQQVNMVNTVDKSVVQEFKRVFDTLWLRIFQFFEKPQPASVLDENQEEKLPSIKGEVVLESDVMDTYMVTNGLPNMNFSVFCSLYAGGLLRRLFYYNELVLNKLHLPPAKPPFVKWAEAAKKWVYQIVHGFADEAFEDMYNSIVPEGYNFIGDDHWFKYYWPHKIHSRAACINKFRPHLHKSFFSESTLNKDTVLKAYKTSHVTRLFILKAIDEYLKIRMARVEWMNAAVVYNEDIEMASSILEQDRVPVILQVFSSFWVYDKFCVHITDDIFEAIYVWFYILKVKYKCMLHDVDMTEIVNDIIVVN
ncbi:MAG: hypothetical protein K2Q45_06830 [Nitrosomonas sp.]|nr:hypothetical protein [Nitrosomonas sp.]